MKEGRERLMQLISPECQAWARVSMLDCHTFLRELLFPSYMGSKGGPMRLSHLSKVTQPRSCENWIYIHICMTNSIFFHSTWLPRELEPKRVNLSTVHLRNGHKTQG